MVSLSLSLFSGENVRRTIGFYHGFYHEVGAPKKQVGNTHTQLQDWLLFSSIYRWLTGFPPFTFFFFPRTDVGAKRAAAIAGDELHGCGLSHLSHGTPVVAGDLAPRIAGAGCKVLGDPWGIFLGKLSGESSYNHGLYFRLVFFNLPIYPDIWCFLSHFG